MEWHIIGILAFVAMIIYRFCQENKNSESRQKTTNEVNHYLKLMFDSFFRTARTLDVEIEKCRLQECER